MVAQVTQSLPTVSLASMNARLLRLRQKKTSWDVRNS